MGGGNGCLAGGKKGLEFRLSLGRVYGSSGLVCGTGMAVEGGEVWVGWVGVEVRQG